MATKPIIFFTVGTFDNRCLTTLVDEITDVFQLPIVVESLEVDLSAFYDEKRRQYDGNKLLKEIDQIIKDQGIKKIALFQVDLFIPILTYIFGQAIFKGDSAIVSVYRLKNELYGMDQNPLLQFRRFKKVIIHEIGHTFGLKHCQYHKCVMRSSTYVEDIDQKNPVFCSSCKQELKELLHKY